MRVTGALLIAAAIAFWIGWLLMPGVGITDAALILDAVGACAIAADAIFHFVAYEMTAPGVDRAAMLPAMVQLKTTDLRYLLPLVLALFLGAGALAGGASRARLVSRWNPRLHGIAFATAVAGGVLLGPRGGGRHGSCRTA